MNSSDYKVFSKFLSDLAKKLTKYYYLKLNKPFKVSNKEKGRAYDPVTSADKAFEKFIRWEIIKKFMLIGKKTQRHFGKNNLKILIGNKILKRY